ncbi:hypothetical protein [Vibrio sp. HN007]|uniref:hypothetical protein n=1 Tax=Vibrio iocasae TaxID=3098914 RepID=UPI0035D45A22
MSYLKSHPVSYRSVLLPFTALSLISAVAWFLILFEVNPEFFGNLLLEQVALKWIWIFASLSIVFLSVKFARTGPVNDYGNKYVKVVGIHFANTALSMSAGYVGIMWGALLPIYLLQDNLNLPVEYAFINLLVACLLALVGVVLLYCFYLVLMANKDAPQWHYELVSSKTTKYLVGLFAFAFISGRLPDVLRVFRPDLF